MDMITENHSLNKFVKENNLVSKILVKFNLMPNLQTLKFDIEM